MGEKLFVAVLVLVTALYCYGLGWIAVGFARSGEPIGWGLALGVGIFVVLTVWVTWREVLFGLAAGRAGRAYRAEEEAGRIPPPLGEPRAEFEQARNALQGEELTSASPGSSGDWRAWYRLGLAYDALHDRKHARAAVRRALAARRSR